jgi:hypothetical protein
MRDLWTIGPTAAAHSLRACGFTPRQADCLVALKLRYNRGSFRELTTSQKRLLFVKWLVEHGHLSKGQAVSSSIRTSDAQQHRRSPQ